MTVKGGTSQACAACKYQRRKCLAECPLAPYFPPDSPRLFQNAHKLFGVNKILKVLNKLDPSQKWEAMRSIIYESQIRDRYPVYGSYGVMWTLQLQIQQTQQELEYVHAQLAVYRQQHTHQIQSPPSSQLQLGTASAHNALPLFHHNDHQAFNAITTGISLTAAPLHSFPNNNATGNNYSSININNNLNPLWIQHPFNNNDNNNNINDNLFQSQFVQSQSLSNHHQAIEAPHEYDEISPFFDTIDDQQSYIDSKEAYESSSEESLKDTTQSIEHICENELKSAAACFTLTSVN